VTFSEIAPIVFLVGLIIRSISKSQKNSRVEQMYSTLLARSRSESEQFSESDIANLPAGAKKYFQFSMAHDAWLRLGCEIRMKGRCSMGGSRWKKYQKFTAKEVLARPQQVVWLAHTFSGWVSVFHAFDVSFEGDSWSVFYYSGYSQMTPSNRRMVLARTIADVLFVPAALLPRYGTRWEDLGGSRFLVHTNIRQVPCKLEFALNDDGSVKSVDVRDWGTTDSGCLNGQLTLWVQESAWFDDYRIPRSIVCSTFVGGLDYDFLDINLEYVGFR